MSVPTSSETGQGQRGMEAAGGRVEGKLADRDGHAAGALVAETQDPLVVGHDDEADVLVRPLPEDLGDAMQVVGRDPRPAGASEDVAELLAGAPDRGRVDDRQELVEVLGQEPVEQGGVAVLERGEADVLLEVVVLDPQVLEFERHLLVDGEDAGRQQAVELERVTLVIGEGEVLGQQAAAEQRRAGDADPGGAAGGHDVERRGERSHVYASRIRVRGWCRWSRTGDGAGACRGAPGAPTAGVRRPPGRADRRGVPTAGA